MATIMVPVSYHHADDNLYKGNANSNLTYCWRLMKKNNSADGKPQVSSLNNNMIGAPQAKFTATGTHLGLNNGNAM